VEEAEACTAKATQLDPFSSFIYGAGALTMYGLKRYDAAIQLGERAIELQSDHTLGLWSLGLISCKLGRYERAIETLKRGALISKHAAFFVGYLGMAYGLAGRRTDALTLRDEL